jgi:hypothetical protein
VQLRHFFCVRFIKLGRLTLGKLVHLQAHQQSLIQVSYNNRLDAGGSAGASALASTKRLA